VQTVYAIAITILLRHVAQTACIASLRSDADAAAAAVVASNDDITASRTQRDNAIPPMSGVVWLTVEITDALIDDGTTLVECYGA